MAMLIKIYFFRDLTPCTSVCIIDTHVSDDQLISLFREIREDEELEPVQQSTCCYIPKGGNFRHGGL
jgi:hypothetical protein